MSAERQRALRGSIGTAYLLKLPDELSEQVRRAAKRAKLSLAEWWRQAAVEKLERSK